MRTKEKRNKTNTFLPRAVSFLFEESKFSYIKQYDKNNPSREVFSMKTFANSIRKENIVKVLEEDNFFNNKYPFIDISVLNNQFTLVPIEYFDEENCEIYLNYNVPFFKEKGLRFNLIPQFNLALIFYYKEELEEIFSEISEKIRITHTGFKFLSKIGNLKKDGVFITIYNEYLEVAVIENSKLLLYNIYPAKSVQDLAYFLQLIFKNLKIEIEKNDLFYFGKFEGKGEDILKLGPLFKNIEPGIENYFERVNFTTLDLI